MGLFSRSKDATRDSASRPISDRLYGPLTIRSAQVLEYRMPLKRTAKTSHRRTASAMNFLVRLEAHGETAAVHGVGEGSPRSTMTGDDPEGSWTFLCAAVDRLITREFAIEQRQAALTGVSETMAELRDLAEAMAPDTVEKPYRGTLLGIEVALLDLVSRALGLSLAEIFGKVRREVRVSALTISATKDLTQMKKKLEVQIDRYSLCRMKGTGDADQDLALLATAQAVQRRAKSSVTTWLDINEGMDAATADAFVTDVVAGMRVRDLPAKVIIEQPVPRHQWRTLVDLQRKANALSRRGSELRIMPDESLWDRQDFRKLEEAGGCRAINIKIQKAGGLIASLELAAEARKASRDVEVCIGGALGTSDLTTWALYHLALAMPRLDYLTFAPPYNSETRIVDLPAEYSTPGSTVLTPSHGPGLGSSVDLESLMPYVIRNFRIPSPEAQRDTSCETANTYRTDHLTGFGTLGLDSHILEREALRRGLHTLRLSSNIFFAGSRQDDLPYPLAFNGGAGTATRASIIVAVNKQFTRIMLQRAGVPVPDGQSFTIGEHEQAISYAQHIGFPVVVKPQKGQGGAGVVSNIRNEKDLRWALEGLQRTKYAEQSFLVEEHFPGEDFRFFVLGEQVLSVLRRTPASITGDGFQTVSELIFQKNMLRRNNPHLRTRLIRDVEAARRQLKDQGLEIDSVPEAGRTVVLTFAGNLTQGGDSVEVLDRTHPSLQEAAVRAMKAVPGLKHAGIDFLIEDLQKPLNQQRAGICEINSAPGQTANDFPLYGVAKPVSGQIIEWYADHSGVDLTAARDHLTLELIIEGAVQGVGYRRWLARQARELRIDGWAANREDGSVKAVLSGDAEATSAVASRCISGPRPAMPQAVTASPVHEITAAGFELRK